MAGPPSIVIDARPRGPRGPFAVEPVRGRAVLDHLLDLAGEINPNGAVAVLADGEDRHAISSAAGDRGRVVEGPAPAGSVVLRTDRLYDPAKLRAAVRRGLDPESSAFWRLDRPHGLDGAGDELVRRRTFQPLGRYWALGPARVVARTLAPTRVRPNAVTLAASGLFLGAAGVVAFAGRGLIPQLLATTGLGVALILDTADGHLARLQGTASAFGKWLDGWLDEVGDMALHAAAAWSAYSQSGAVGWLLLGMSYAMGKYVFVAGNLGWDEGAAGDAAEAAPAAESPPTRWVRLAGHADLRWHLWIVLAAVGRLDAALAAYAVYFPARALLGAARKGARRG